MQSIKMSPELKKFYQEMELIINKDVYEKWFVRHHGFCLNLRKYFLSSGIEIEKVMLLMDEMIDQFIYFGLDITYPFNFGNTINYLDEGIDKYQNPFRLYWINEMAKPEPEETS